MAEADAIEQAVQALQGGSPEQAVAICNAALMTAPNDVDLLHFRGISLHYLGKPEEAIDSIRESLLGAPMNASAHLDLGNLLKGQDREDEALESYKIALDLEPGNARCLNNVATIHRNKGELKDAIQALKLAVQVEPDLAEAHHNLANCLSDDGRTGEALAAYQRSFELGGDWSDPLRPATLLIAVGREKEAEALLSGFVERHPDHEGAKHHLAGLRGETMERASDSYVAEHFDDFASSFDAVLKGLDYRAPKLVADAVAARYGAPGADKDVLDLGCGTGLCGPLIAPYKRELTGIDLSQKMLHRAQKRGCYDALYVAELQAFLEALDPDSLDLVVCVDTLVYLGALERCFSGVARVLRRGGAFIATAEALNGEGDHKLGASGRFQHSRAYLERLAATQGLTVDGVTDAVLRKEGDKTIDGFVLEVTVD